MKSAYQEMDATPALKGVQLRLTWSDLESSKDVYDFTVIDGHLDKLSTTGTKTKRLIVILETKSFSVGGRLIPKYLTDPADPGYVPAYEGGSYPWGGTANGTDAKDHKGDAIRLWNTGVRDRLVQLMRQLGARYNAHSHFEGMGLGETSMGQALTPLTDAQVDAYYSAHLFIQREMRTAFPNTMTTQFTNYPRKMLQAFVHELSTMGTALGGPDILLDDPGLNMAGNPNTADGVYSYYPKLSGVVPLTPSIMSSNYRQTTATGEPPTRQPTLDELLTFGRDRLKANYLFWGREPAFYPAVLAKLNELTQSGSPAVELDTRCPTAYVSCVTD